MHRNFRCFLDHPIQNVMEKENDDTRSPHIYRLFRALMFNCCLHHPSNIFSAQNELYFSHLISNSIASSCVSCIEDWTTGSRSASPSAFILSCSLHVIPIRDEITSRHTFTITAKCSSHNLALGRSRQKGFSIENGHYKMHSIVSC